MAIVKIMQALDVSRGKDSGQERTLVECAGRCFEISSLKKAYDTGMPEILVFFSDSEGNRCKEYLHWLDFSVYTVDGVGGQYATFEQVCIELAQWCDGHVAPSGSIQ